MTKQEIIRKIQANLWDYSVHETRPVRHPEKVAKYVDELIDLLENEGVGRNIAEKAIYKGFDPVDDEREVWSASMRLSRKLRRMGLEANFQILRATLAEAERAKAVEAGTVIECADGEIHVDGEIARVYFEYNASLVAAVKTIPGRQWNPADRCWEIPAAQMAGAVEILGGKNQS